MGCLHLVVLLRVLCCCDVVIGFCLGVILVVLFCWLLCLIVIVVGDVFI